MTGAPSRGRRPGAPDTRAEILHAARELFAHKGFAGTTIRGVAAQAGVDPALVHHYFGSKDDLLLASFQAPVDPREVVAQVVQGDLDGLGQRLVTAILGVWEEPSNRLALLALLRVSLTHEESASLTREVLGRLILGTIRGVLPPEEADVRAGLAATQIAGVVILRHLIRIEPVASMPVDDLVAWVAPGVQRYLTGPLPS